MRQSADTEDIETALSGGEASVVTYLSRALNSQGVDEFVSRVADSSGVQVDPLDTDVARSVGDDHVQTVIQGLDDASSLQEVQVEGLGTGVAAGTFGLVTYLSRALNTQAADELVNRITDSSGTQIDPLNQDALQTVGGDELRSRLHDSTGAQINPDQSPDYPDSQTVGHDLIGTGDLTIGPVSVARSAAVVITANSTDANAWSASVSWGDGSGNVFHSESASDIGLSQVTSDWARLVRKGPQVTVTLTDESGGAANNVNVHVDVER